MTELNKKMFVSDLLDFATKNNIDVSKIHSGKGFRTIKKVTFKQPDLYNEIKKAMDIKIVDSLNNVIANKQLEIDIKEDKNNELKENKVNEPDQKNDKLKLDFNNTSIKDYYNFALKKDASLSHILQKIYGFITDKTTFVKVICQLLKLDENDYLPNKEYTEVKQDLTDFDKSKLRLFDNIYHRLSDFVNDLCTKEKSYDYVKFALMRDDTATDLYKFVASQGEDNQVNQFTLSNVLSDLKTYLTPKVLNDNLNFPNNILLTNFIDLIKGVKERKEIKENLVKKREITNTHVNKRQSNILFIECKGLINWSIKTLQQLENKEYWDNQKRDIKAQWTNIALSLMLLTGRRSSEIMSSASFKKIDDYHLEFIGQLKGNSYSTEPMEIPVLCKADLILLGMQWLEYMDKREKSDFLKDDDSTIKARAKKSHSRFSRYLNEDIKGIFADNVIVKNQENLTISYDDGKTKNRVNCHLLRQIYSQIAYQIFFYDKEVPIKKHFALAQILGHEDNENNAKKASENYDSDFEIKDYEEISKLINY